MYLLHGTKSKESLCLGGSCGPLSACPMGGSAWRLPSCRGSTA